MTVTGPAKGADPKRVQLTDNKDGTYTGEYLPILHGNHEVMVELQGKPVAQSPIRVPIARDPNAADPSKSWAEHLNDPTTIERKLKFREEILFHLFLKTCPFPIAVKMRLHAVRPDGKPCTKGGDPFDVEVTDPNGDLVPATIRDNGESCSVDLISLAES